MFALHETTQRHICRAIFLLVCVLPTLATLAWIAHTHRPWRERDWQQTLSEQLHVHAEVGTINNPRPGVTQLTHVRLSDLRSRKLLVAMKGVSIERSGGLIEIHADHIEAEVDQVGALSEAVSTWLSTVGFPSVDLHVDRVTIAGPSLEALQMDNLHVLSESESAGAGRLKLRAAPAGHEADDQASPIQLIVECQQGTAVHVALDTHQLRLPTWLVDDVIPAVGNCRGSMFSGSLQMVDDGGTLGGTFTGQVSEIDLQQLVGAGSPHRWEGSATVDLDQLQWRDGRIDVANGRLHAGRGRISRSLLNEFITRLYCVAAVPPATAGDSSAADISVDELACRFQLSRGGITLNGDCQSDVGGCLLMSQGAPLLLQPPNHIPWLAQLVQVFHLPAKSWLPATQEAHAMSGTLPLPSAESDVVSRPPSVTAARSSSQKKQ